jgi:hypothetical protein
MHFLPASRTKRRLIKIASLGLAGLLAGLLSGCDSADASVHSSKLQTADYSSVDALTGTEVSALPASIEATQIPALHHAPSARRLQFGSIHTSSQALQSGRNGY